MKTGQVALAFTSGYIIGRNHKMRWVLTLAAMAAGRRLASGHGPVDTEALKSTELGQLTQGFRDQLVSAGRSAAMSTASHQMDALSDRLESRTAALRGEKPEKESEEEEEKKEKEPESDAKPKAGTKAGAKGKSEERSGSSKPKKSADRPAKAKKKADTGGSRRRSQG